MELFILEFKQVTSPPTNRSLHTDTTVSEEVKAPPEKVQRLSELVSDMVFKDPATLRVMKINYSDYVLSK